MNNKKNISADFFVCTVASVSMILCASLLIGFYFYVKFVPLLLMALILLLPAVINLFLLLPKEQKFIKQPKAEKIKGQKKTFKQRIKDFWISLKKCPQKIKKAFLGNTEKILVVMTVLTVVSVNVLYWFFAKKASAHVLGFITPIILAAMFVVFIVIDKWCKYSKQRFENTRYEIIAENLRSVTYFAKIMFGASAAVTAVCVLGFFDLQQILIIALDVILIYETVFLILSFAVRLIRKELYVNPDMVIPVPGKSKENLGVLSYLEKNTGITMRSLWSIRLIKKIIPFAVIFSALALWLSTGIVQIEAYQHGAKYTLGKLKTSNMAPGIHLTLPWPFDEVKLYDTQNIKEITIGYVSEGTSDNLWTESHGNSEYKLLLGGGNELVSMNLRVEYKISDLGNYLKCSAKPESLLESAAYETITNRTINTNLDSLLATDRTEFSKSFEKELKNRIAKYNTGLEIVDVILESIHPPVEVAQIYQRIISAGIEAEKIVLDAQALAGVTLAEAKEQHDKDINDATAKSSKDIADANAAIAEFMASVEANKEYKDGYRYYKYLDALKKSYADSKLIIVGDGVNSANLYIGSVS